MSSPPPNSANDKTTEQSAPKSQTVIYKRGDIVLFDFGPMVVDTKIITKERPSLILRDNEADPAYALVLQNNLQNKYAGTVILAPFTSSEFDKEYPFQVQCKHFVSPIDPKKFKKIGVLKLDQIFTVDKCWIKECIASLNVADLKRIDKALLFSFGIMIP